MQERTTVIFDFKKRAKQSGTDFLQFGIILAQMLHKDLEWN
jgi:hypothetical protein